MPETRKQYLLRLALKMADFQAEVFPCLCLSEFCLPYVARRHVVKLPWFKSVSNSLVTIQTLLNEPFLVL